MALVIETFITCDKGCGATFGVDNRDRKGAEQRRYALHNGWAHGSGKDTCPNCRKNKQPKLKSDPGIITVADAYRGLQDFYDKKESDAK